jgi:Arc/MetJ-type ribon-helix-helix transcriptional regulator
MQKQDLYRPAKAENTMTEWRTVNINKELKEEIKKEKVENGDFTSAKDFIVHSARKELERSRDEISKEKIRQVLKEENLI